MTGIYTITNLVNGKMYVGYASDMKERFRLHKYYLNLNGHHCCYLQHAWNKYGEENFEFEDIEECEEWLLPALEHYWATILKVHDNRFGYNDKATHPNGTPRHSEETKRKIGLAHKGKTKKKSSIKKAIKSLKKTQKERGYAFAPDSKFWTAMEARKGIPATSKNAANAAKIVCSLKIKQYTIEGEFVRTWDSIADAERAIVGKKTGKICCACNGLRPSAYKFIWRFEEDGFDKFEYRKRGNQTGYIHRKGFDRNGNKLKRKRRKKK